MAQDQHNRTIRDKIERLRRRMGEGPEDSGAAEVMKLRNVVKGILDLLADEL